MRQAIEVVRRVEVDAVLGGHDKWEAAVRWKASVCEKFGALKDVDRPIGSKGLGQVLAAGIRKLLVEQGLESTVTANLEGLEG